MGQDDVAGVPKAADAGLRDPERLVGKTLGGKYRVLDVLARGGMGRIYRAEQVPLGRAVALKVLHSDLDETGGDPDFQKRFLLEAASCARLRHPNIVVVYDYGRLEELGREAYFMAMELIEGRTLHHVLREELVLPPPRALRIAREVARALREAHRQEMVHRDLKPSNVMLVATGEGEQVKVLDFGLVKVMRDDSEELTREGQFFGSPKYMAPEQIRRGPVDGRADIYALGVMLYQMLSGQLPFEGQQAVQTLMAHLNDPVPPFSEALALPAAVQALVMRCLEKEPSMRFASVDELIAAIDDVAPLLPGWASEGRLALTSSGEVPAYTTSTSSFPRALGDASRSLAGAAPPAAVSASADAPRASRGAMIAVVAGAALLAAVVAVVAGRPAAPEHDEGLEAGPAVAVPSSAPSSPAAAPPTAARSPTAAPAPVEPAPARFTVFVASEPSGATLYRGDEAIGTTPTFVELESAALGDAPATFRLELEGHAPYLWTQGPASDDVHVDAQLAALPPQRDTRPSRAERRRDRSGSREDSPAAAPEDFAIKTRR